MPKSNVTTLLLPHFITELCKCDRIFEMIYGEFLIILKLFPKGIIDCHEGLKRCTS